MVGLGHSWILKNLKKRVGPKQKTKFALFASPLNPRLYKIYLRVYHTTNNFFTSQSGLCLFYLTILTRVVKYISEPGIWSLDTKISFILKPTNYLVMTSLHKQYCKSTTEHWIQRKYRFSFTKMGFLCL